MTEDEARKLKKGNKVWFSPDEHVMSELFHESDFHLGKGVPILRKCKVVANTVNIDGLIDVQVYGPNTASGFTLEPRDLHHTKEEAVAAWKLAFKRALKQHSGIGKLYRLAKKLGV